MLKEKNISGEGNVEQSIVGQSNQQSTEPPTDFKIAEIWIKDGQIVLDASESFWSDKVRALGVIELCKDIIKTAKLPEPEKSKIITGETQNGGIMNFVRNGLKKNRRK